MKKYLIVLNSLLVFGLAGCNTLDIDNLTDFDAGKVWQDPELATAYITNLYPEVFGNWEYDADQNSDQVTGMPFYANVITISGGSYKRWEYTKIRNINEAIQRLEDGSLPADVKRSLRAQALFMRAYVYFDMVVYHGGVPYIKTPQNREKDDLYVERNSSEECFDFIIDDLDEAISGGLPDKINSSSADYGRIDKSFAKAFKAKVLLYKASPQFNPLNPYTNPYWEEAYTAATEAYEWAVDNGSALTPKYDDIFLKEGGAEVLLAVINEYPDKTAVWGYYLRPQSLSQGAIRHTPTWDMVKAFPMADGKRFDDPAGRYRVGTENELMQNFWKNRDPRFYSSIFCSGQEYPVAGRPAGYRQYTALGLCDPVDAYGTNRNSGGAVASKNDVMSGFFVRKALDMSLSQDISGWYDIDHIEMRFAELMLIYAEAANETGHPDVTVDMLERIRQRAGIEAGTDGNYGLPASPSRQQLRELILDERNIELCFEGHRFWDLRRTRNLDKLYGLQKYGLESIAINPGGGGDMPIADAKRKAERYELTPADFRYVKQRVPLNPNAENTFVVDESFYFFPLQKTVLDENTNLKQNDTWGGTFNPTLE